MIEGITGYVSNALIDNMLPKLLTTQYGENLFDTVTTAQKVTVHAALEACLRGELGKALERPLGSPNVHSYWSKLFLNPTQLFSLPTADNTTISTEVTIGKNAKKPLKLSMPIMISAMSYGGSLSLDAKVSLAKAASKVGTATNTGESALSNEERESASLLIGQYNRYEVMNTKDQLSRLDAIEVQLGQGAWGGALPANIKADKIRQHMRETWHLKHGQDGIRGARFKGINSSQDIINLLNNLKSQYDVPIGVKIAGTHYIEKELDVILQTNVDFIVIDGSEGGTAASMVTLQDDVGLPTLYSLSRAAKYLDSKGVKNKYDLIITGGLKTPGDFVKALALGANAVYIGTIALMALIQSQITKALPEYPAPQMVLYNGKLTDRLDIDRGAETLANFLTSSVEEMKLVLIAMGKDNINQLNSKDLVSVDKELSEVLGIGYAGYPS
ncbi:FMN-binding glutamate synthase family protein [Clostridium sp. CX1]|uniref:FMN-binding glutamate synthase family protein n=1 Tax=Clostridium tanneri TaxID=3037988 RepID=A0ABU4JS78_9CLOT|nr:MULTISPECIES: FMN-binding glutamate synthase family protein [unclassified Clostridium]MCT8978580.1 FMN-binding glutamate synthase family protein [Clostridium sp. CX1]MDW8800982.1 FMN-binding glutamate synthase family protein [Clostridium sp. A1-XYC3]